MFVRPPLCFVLLAALVVTLGPLLSAQSQTAAPSAPRIAPAQDSHPAVSELIQQDVEYGKAGGEALLLDIYQPPERSSHPRPAVVLIHGGGWTNFDKSTMRGMANFLAHSGFVAVSINYRLLTANGNRWPAQLDDAQRAVRWLRANASKYNIDPAHIGAFGHSAGAQLAALLGLVDTRENGTRGNDTRDNATRDNSDPALAKFSSKVQAVVDVSGPTDFLTERDADNEAFLTNFFGGDKTKAADVWRSASPALQVTSSASPFLILQGTTDDQVPMQQAQELYDKLRQAGVDATLIKIEDGHTFQTSEARHRLASESLVFFSRYLMNDR
jgi:acetyl esterase/lipase